MSEVQIVVSNWVEENRLVVNPEKTKLIHSTKKYKIPEVRLPKTKGEILVLSREAKYLGVILVSKVFLEREHGTL